MPEFAHLHCHTQFSLLDGAASIPSLFKKAAADGMKGIAITDHGNMFGAFQFVAEASKHKGVKPIVGCEFYVVENRHRKTFTKEDEAKTFYEGVDFISNDYQLFKLTIEKELVNDGVLEIPAMELNL